MIIIALSPCSGHAHAAFASGSVNDRKHSAWVGGSVLASLGTFQQLWVSRESYKENGFSVVEKRCDK